MKKLLKYRDLAAKQKTNISFPAVCCPTVLLVRSDTFDERNSVSAKFPSSILQNLDRVKFSVEWKGAIES